MPTALPAQGREVRAADSLLLDLHRRGLFNGAVVLGRSDEVYARGFGYANAAARLPFTPDTPVDAASIAKTLTATAVFLLEQQGRLTLDDFARQHVPEYPHARVRLRHLLSHTVGLPEAEYDFFNDLIPVDRVRTTPLLLGLLQDRDVPPAFPPGAKFRYSNLGFDAAALVVERVTGEPFDVFLKRRIFEPLGMDSAFLRPARLAEWRGVRTLSYRRAGDTLVVHDVFDNEGFYGGSNFYMSARDLYRWSRSFYTKPILPTGAIARGTEAAVIWDSTTHTGGRPGVNYLGWYYPERGRRYHYPGSLQGFWSSTYRDEEQRFSVTYVSNNSMPQWLRPLLSRALIAIMEGRLVAPIEVPTFLAISPKELDAIAGRYVVDGVGTVTLRADKNRALMQIGGGIEYPAYLVDDAQLYVPGLDVWIGFPAVPSAQFSRLSWLSIFHVAHGTRAQP